MAEVRMSYAYCYLAGALFNLGLWFFFYVRRADLRREMVVMSCVPIVMGLPQEYFLWTTDWWQPPTVTGTRIGFEDVIYAIGTGGLFSALYATVFGRRSVPGKAPSLGMAALPLLVNFCLPFALVYLAGLHSFVACAVGAAFALVWILLVRPDLLKVALASAGLSISLSLPCFWFMEWLAPGFVAATWRLPMLSGVLVTGVPMEDVLWYAYTAALFGVYYKYASGARLVEGVPVAGHAATAPVH